jgi:hypothetical protein
MVHQPLPALSAAHRQQRVGLPVVRSRRETWLEMNSMLAIAIFLFWIVFAAIIGVAADARGQPGIGWFLRCAVMFEPIRLAFANDAHDSIRKRHRQ